MPLRLQASASWNTAAGHDSDVALVITVNQSNGDPLASLQQSDFKVYETAGTIGPETSREVTPFFAFAEHPSSGAPGAYMIGVDGGGKWGGSIAIFIVDVESGGERGRAMTSVRF
jgi:hypothetical protein